MRDITTITDAIRQSVTARDAAQALGIRVNRQGRCPCPVHNGTDDNMRLYPGEGGYHCFVCGASGDVIHLVQAVQECSFLNALEWLNSAFRLGLDIDKQMDKNAQEAAEMARKHRQTVRAQKEAIERMEFDLYCAVGKWLADLESDKERYRPRTGKEEWDERFVTALRMIPEVKELAETLAVEMIGVKLE